MERERFTRNIFSQIDWFTISLYFLMVFIGWINIYAAIYDPDPLTHKSIFSLSSNSGRQFLWIMLSMVIILFIMLMDFRFYDTFAYPIFGATILLLLAVLLFGTEIYGSKSWFKIGSFSIQPAEFAKVGTALAVARFLGETNKKTERLIDFILPFFIIIIPALLIIKQGDTGSALVFSSFLLVFYREGFPQQLVVIGLIIVVLFILTLIFQEKYLLELILSITALGLVFIFAGKRKWQRVLIITILTLVSVGLILSVNFLVNKLEPHQRERVQIIAKLMSNTELTKDEKRGIAYQTEQSKIAISAGGFTGKGFLEGTQTKFDYVPKQSTDFIFCTIGEEHGWLGSLLMIGLFIAFLNRLIILAERQKSRFSRIYGYTVMSIFLFHFTINIGMTIGLFPVIGIPLPFFSYGGSSLWGFTILLFVMIKLDAHRKQLIVRY
jgi:rod shape determining protein RodA